MLVSPFRRSNPVLRNGYSSLRFGLALAGERLCVHIHRIFAGERKSFPIGASARLPGWYRYPDSSSTSCWYGPRILEDPFRDINTLEDYLQAQRIPVVKSAVSGTTQVSEMSVHCLMRRLSYTKPLVGREVISENRVAGESFEEMGKDMEAGEIENDQVASDSVLTFAAKAMDGNVCLTTVDLRSASPRHVFQLYKQFLKTLSEGSCVLVKRRQTIF